MDHHIVPQRPIDEAQLEPLLDRTFGPDRFDKTVYRLREGLEPVPGLSHVAVNPQGKLLASLRFWPVTLAGRQGILLGPLAVEPPLQGKGIGKSLVRHGLSQARRLGHDYCLVVGEPEYYEPFGFRNAPAAGLILPGPVDSHRFQVLELSPGSLEGARGLVERAEGQAIDTEDAEAC